MKTFVLFIIFVLGTVITTFGVSHHTGWAVFTGFFICTAAIITVLNPLGVESGKIN